MKHTWEGILEQVTVFQNKVRSEGLSAWFRGHSCSDWKVKSSLHRYVEEMLEFVGMQENENEKMALMAEEYKTLYRRFMQDAWLLLEPHERSDWGIIFSMQHHGIPTRLLDWTESFACALYFALLDKKAGEEAVLYLLCPEGLNSIALGQLSMIALHENCNPNEPKTHDTQYHPRFKKQEDVLETIAIIPFFSNPRMRAQRSAFTLCGDSFQPLEEQFDGQLANKGYIERIVLPPEVIQEANRFLDLVGIGHFGYFPISTG